MRHIQRWFALVATALILLPGAPVRAQPLQTLRVAVVPGDISAQCWYAQELGYFKDEGLDVVVTPIPNGAAISAGVASGSLDIGFSSAITIALAHQRGIPFEIIAPANLNVASAPSAGLLSVKTDSPIRTAKDLENKTVAVGGIDNITYFSARAWIDAHGGDSTKVRFFELPLTQQADAVKSGRVAAATLDALGFANGNRTGKNLRILASTFDAASPNFAVAVWFSTHSWISAHPELLKKFIMAMERSAVWANAHHRESAAILAKHTKLTPALLEHATRVTYGTTLNAAMIQPNIDIAAKYGKLPKTLRAADLISKQAEDEVALAAAKASR